MLSKNNIITNNKNNITKHHPELKWGNKFFWS